MALCLRVAEAEQQLGSRGVGALLSICYREGLPRCTEPDRCDGVLHRPAQAQHRFATRVQHRVQHRSAPDSDRLDMDFTGAADFVDMPIVREVVRQRFPRLGVQASRHMQQ